MATYLYRTFSTATNRKIWTWSGWIKRTNSVTDHQNALFGCYYNGSNRSVIRFNEHRLQFQDSGNSVDVQTTRKFRDPNAWYHIVARVDTTQSTASDRVRLYVNGVQETVFDTSNYPGQNINMEFQGTVVHYINARREGGGAIDSIASMVYSHVHFSDGQSLAPTVFGSTDSTTGEWKINTSPSFTLGTNGFTILKDGNTYTDQSSNSNNWTLAGSTGLISKTEDCPSNVFATLNPLFTSSNTINFSNGNTRATGVDYQNQRTGGTLASSSGKFYFESKITGSTDFGGSVIGIYDFEGTNLDSNSWFGNANNFVGFYASGNILKVIYNGNINNYGSVSVGDIIGFAFDIDNGFAYISKNGTFLNSGVPTSGSTGTGNVNRSGNLNYNFAGKLMGNAGGFQVTDSMYSNFGNGYFGTTAVSSAGTNASSNGIFEYDVPTGYTALSTKGLNL